ncbi:redox-regulated ATPase YchF [Candidatus Aerophobetes bacterium]|nr:redox-regulated ATPase YchF [Candidatus Aerophobetes bacterium]
MKIGIIGLPQVGKKTIFRLLTGVDLSKEVSDSKDKVRFGIAKIRDDRFDKLVSLYSPKKKVPANIEFALLPKIGKETISSGEVFKAIFDVDAICHIVRVFKDESIFHINETIDPIRDIEQVNSELILNDLIFVEKRLEKIEKDSRKGLKKVRKEEEEILLKIKAHLDKEMPLRTLLLDKEEEKLLSGYQFITKKGMMIVLNVGEEEIKNEKDLKQISEKYKDQKIEVMQVSAKIEEELSEFESEGERKAFLDELGIKESALDKMTRLCYKTLGLISFFTVGKDEVREWTIKRDSTAPRAAGAIHTDLERGFIRAEVMKYDNLIEFGSESSVKKAGKYMVKGKDYIVEDGDIINIRFNV